VAEAQQYRRATMTPKEQLDAFIDRFTPDVATLARRALGRMGSSSTNLSVSSPKRPVVMNSMPCTDPVLDGARGVTQARVRGRSVSA
jgi:hypothetical protein